MTYEKFTQTLKDNGMSLKKFSELSGSNYSTCSKWGKSGRPVSDWVDSWLNLYLENVRYQEFKRLIKASGVCE